MTTPVIEAGLGVNLTASGDVTLVNTSLMGFYVNSSSGGTLQLKAGGSGGTALGGVITPQIGFHPYPVNAQGGLYALITGTIDITFFVKRNG